MMERESDQFGVPQYVDVLTLMTDGRWYSLPALGRLSGYGRDHLKSYFRALLRWGWVEVADNPNCPTGKHVSGVALWRTGPHVKGPVPDWPRAVPRRLYRITGAGRRGIERARKWALLGLPWKFNVIGVSGARSWRHGSFERAVGLAAEHQARAAAAKASTGAREAAYASSRSGASRGRRRRGRRA